MNEDAETVIRGGCHRSACSGRRKWLPKPSLREDDGGTASCVTHGSHTGKGTRGAVSEEPVHASAETAESD